MKDVMQMHELGELVSKFIVEARAVPDGVIGIPTGWRTLDRETNGWQNGDMIVVLARLKMGKSLIMLQMANAAWDAGYKPMLVSMEMPALQMGRRFFAMRSGLNMKLVNQGRISTWALDKIEQEAKDMATKHPFYYVEGQFKKDIMEIGDTINDNKPDIVFIDGGYLIKMASYDTRQKWDKMAEIAQTLKFIAINFNIPVVVSFQFNRQVDRKRKNIEEEAFDKIQLADAIGQLASTGIAILDDDTEIDPTRIIEIIGGRSGEKGNFKIKWNWEQMCFDEIIRGENNESNELEYIDEEVI